MNIDIDWVARDHKGMRQSRAYKQRYAKLPFCPAAIHTQKSYIRNSSHS